MSHILQLNLPDDVYQPLIATALRTKATPEQLAVEWLQAMMRHAALDPVENFIGTLRSDVPDWADQHDKYLGQELNKEIDGANNSEK